jgi:hypothetical protein
MEVFLLYLWLKIDAIRWLLMASFVVVIFPYLFFRFVYAMEGGHGVEKPRTRWLVLAVVLITAHTAIPNTGQTAALVAAHYVVKAAESPEATKLMQVLRKKANEYLEEQLEEAPKKK